MTTRRSVLKTLLAGVAGTLLAGTTTLAGNSAPSDPQRLIVHEWGTFTVLQDEDGRPIGGINTDDEVLPGFVHDIAGINHSSLAELPTIYAKAVPRNHNDVWVRLETPVTYFYPPKNFQGPIDVKVTFRQGWLTQYYPDARPGGPDINEDGRLRWGRLSAKAAGSLEWNGLKLRGTGDGPKTDMKTWTAPRNVQATSVHTPNGEAERYLFYRGVGHLTAPLRVSRAADNSLQIRGDWPLNNEARIGPMVLVDARADGTSAFRVIDAVDVSRDDAGKVLATAPGTFSASEFSKDNLPRIREALHATLVRDGLYGDEAKAMLDTWEVSYFKRPGMRLFFPVPRSWTEHYLPLAVSTSAEITRAMIGRIELVTPDQRATLGRIADGPVSDPEWVDRATEAFNARKADVYAEAWYHEVLEGRRTLLESMNIAVPDDYRAYLSLGRFRNALINDELSRRPSKNLETFVDRYQLKGYDIQ